MGLGTVFWDLDYYFGVRTSILKVRNTVSRFKLLF